MQALTITHTQDADADRAAFRRLFGPAGSQPPLVVARFPEVLRTVQRRAISTADGARVFALARDVCAQAPSRCPRPDEYWVNTVALAVRVGQRALGGAFTFNQLVGPCHTAVLGLLAHGSATAFDPDWAAVNAAQTALKALRLADTAGPWELFFNATPDWLALVYEMSRAYTTLEIAPQASAQSQSTADMVVCPAAAFTNVYSAAQVVSNAGRFNDAHVDAGLEAMINNLVAHHLISTHAVANNVGVNEARTLRAFFVQTQKLFFMSAIAKCVATTMCALAIDGARTALKATHYAPQPVSRNDCARLYASFGPAAPSGILYNPDTRALHVFDVHVHWGDQLHSPRPLPQGCVEDPVVWRRLRREVALRALRVALEPCKELLQRWKATRTWPTLVVANVIVVGALADGAQAVATMHQAKTRRVHVGRYKIMRCFIPVTRVTNADKSACALVPNNAMGRTLVAQLCVERQEFPTAVALLFNSRSLQQGVWPGLLCDNNRLPVQDFRQYEATLGPFFETMR